MLIFEKIRSIKPAQLDGDNCDTKISPYTNLVVNEPVG